MGVQCHQPCMFLVPPRAPCTVPWVVEDVRLQERGRLGVHYQLRALPARSPPNSGAQAFKDSLVCVGRMPQSPLFERHEIKEGWPGADACSSIVGVNASRSGSGRREQGLETRVRRPGMIARCEWTTTRACAFVTETIARIRGKSVEAALSEVSGVGSDSPTSAPAAPFSRPSLFPSNLQSPSYGTHHDHR